MPCDPRVPSVLFFFYANSDTVHSLSAIHMFFDCLALAMGLFASVMANWPSNGVFTYGRVRSVHLATGRSVLTLASKLDRYSRVETLSGFANGLFLCLISIFIVFEAIQRLIDPPDMNTGQLLTVSAVGLAVNLVGMVATGHGHHGHSHGGGGGGGGGHSGHGHSHVRAYLGISLPPDSRC